MKRLILLVFLISLFSVSSAFAFFINSYWDLNAVATADITAPDNYFTADGGDGITESFSQLSYDAYTESVIDFGTGVVVDSGLAYITAMTPVAGSIPVDDESLGESYTLTIQWDDLTGNITSYVPGGEVTADYYSGTFNFYIDYNPLALSLWDETTFTDGFQVATVDVTSGSYELDLSGEAGSSYLLWGEFTYLLDDFWFEGSPGDPGAPIDLNTYLDLGWLLAYTAGDNDPNSEQFSITETANGLFVTSDHNASLQIAVIPEPSTVILLGVGLVGMGILGYRRRNR